MEEILMGIGIAIIGYLAGSLSLSIILSKAVKGVDIREGGSGHASTTNTIRQIGWPAGVLVLIFDILKGAIPVYLALRYSELTWVVPLTAGMAVAGHCWPIFAGFRGGMGLATAGGGLLVIDWVMAFIGLGLLVLLVLVIRHSARAALFTGVLMAPMYYLIGLRGNMVWVSAAVGLVLVIRFSSDWQRQYRELWLDREEPGE